MVKLTSLASCKGLLLFASEPAFAEFQIQEAGIEKGEVEIEYRGAYHWGVPSATDAPLWGLTLLDSDKSALVSSPARRRT
jgi:hypothetical protein